MSEFIIYHNPRCSKSRQTLEVLQKRGIQPQIVEYLQHPLSAGELKALLKKLGLSVRDILRDGEDEFQKLHLGAPGKSEAELLAALARHPILMQRPIVVRGERAVIGRPPEKVRELL